MNTPEKVIGLRAPSTSGGVGVATAGGAPAYTPNPQQMSTSCGVFVPDAVLSGSQYAELPSPVGGRHRSKP
ncbi:MAG: hypothetical protein U5K74_14335 [Gemmatimonadaceae bacterium]|nr:hypothetical protein [Gemmatimonadaceae bacterium]